MQRKGRSASKSRPRPFSRALTRDPVQKMMSVAYKYSNGVHHIFRSILALRRLVILVVKGRRSDMKRMEGHVWKLEREHTVKSLFLLTRWTPVSVRLVLKSTDMEQSCVCPWPTDVCRAALRWRESPVFARLSLSRIHVDAHMKWHKFTSSVSHDEPQGQRNTAGIRIRVGYRSLGLRFGNPKSGQLGNFRGEKTDWAPCIVQC